MSALKFDSWCGRLCLLLLSLAAPAGALAGEGPSAHKVVEETTQQVMTVVQAAPAYIDKDPQRYYDTILGILDPVIDFRGFARGVMGDYATSARYRSLDSAGKKKLTGQLDRFTEVMRRGLVRTYGKGLLAFGGSRIQISKPGEGDAEARSISVRQLIFADGAEPYEVMYQMGRDKSGDWKLRNMIIETVNLGAIYRSQFEAAARKYNGDLDQVIDNWSTANEELGTPENA